MKETRLKRLLVYKAMKLWCKSLVSTKYQQNKIRYENVLLLLAGRAAKPDPVFWVQPNFGLNFWVQTGWVGPQDPKMGQIGSGWPQKGFKFGFNPIMYLKYTWSKPDPIRFWVELGPRGPKLGWVGSGWPSGSELGSNSGQVGRVQFVALLAGAA